LKGNFKFKRRRRRLEKGGKGAKFTNELTPQKKKSAKRRGLGSKYWGGSRNLARQKKGQSLKKTKLSTLSLSAREPPFANFFAGEVLGAQLACGFQAIRRDRKTGRRK